MSNGPRTAAMLARMDQQRRGPAWWLFRVLWRARSFAPMAVHRHLRKLKGYYSGLLFSPRFRKLGPPTILQVLGLRPLGRPDLRS